MKGIILAGGSGTRLYPLTRNISKQLLQIYDRPMVFYPLSVLMMAGIREILVISTPQDMPHFQTLLLDGRELGIYVSYAVQPNPGGLAQAFSIGEAFIGRDSVALILGDNLFAGPQLQKELDIAVQDLEKCKGATIFGYYVNDPRQFGIIEFDAQGYVTSLEEKPSSPNSNYCATGLYFYDNQVVQYARQVMPSSRGELEITDLNRIYLNNGQLNVRILDKGIVWMDMGTHENLVAASSYVKYADTVLHQKIPLPQEIAFRNGWISL